MRSSTLISVFASLSFTALAKPFPVCHYAGSVGSGQNNTRGSNHTGGTQPTDNFNNTQPGSDNTQETNAPSSVNYAQLIDAFAQTVIDTTETALVAGGLQAFLTALDSIDPLAAPTSIDDAAGKLQAIGALLQSNSSLNVYDYAALLRAANLVDSADSLLSFVQGVATGDNSMANINPLINTTIYPKKNPNDAPYDVSEAVLRGAIHIPSGFTGGKKPPVILFPGTGDTGYTTFVGNYIPLLQSSDFADPVWVNVPGYLLDDAQTNAEFAAYAINYIAALTNQNVTILTWSQGGIDTQWALKYWPSTRQVVSNFVAISPDYKGTIDASFISPNGVPMAPSIYQQRYLSDSNFITTLRNNGGDSAYVPTTTVYSGFFDEIVEPQQGDTASAFLDDARDVGVTNNEVQLICGGKGLAGTFYTHEGVLYNPLGFALLRDAMTHSGPGQPERLDLDTVCSTYLTPGLDIGDFLLTENTVLIAGLAILLYEPKVVSESPIKAYAASS